MLDELLVPGVLAENLRIGSEPDEGAVSGGLVGAPLDRDLLPAGAALTLPLVDDSIHSVGVEAGPAFRVKSSRNLMGWAKLRR